MAYILSGLLMGSQSIYSPMAGRTFDSHPERLRQRITSPKSVRNWVLYINYAIDLRKVGLWSGSLGR